MFLLLEDGCNFLALLHFNLRDTEAFFLTRLPRPVERYRLPPCVGMTV